MNIGESLLARRTELGLKQLAVAKAAGITPAALSKIENGMQRPRPETYNALQTVLGLDKCPEEEYVSDSPVINLNILEARTRKAIGELNEILVLIERLRKEQMAK